LVEELEVEVDCLLVLEVLEGILGVRWQVRTGIVWKRVEVGGDGTKWASAELWELRWNWLRWVRLEKCTEVSFYGLSPATLILAWPATLIFHGYFVTGVIG
jgi:hypothetical protein